MFCLIVDGMEQNTIMAPKFQQLVKEFKEHKNTNGKVLVHGLAICVL